MNHCRWVAQGAQCCDHAASSIDDLFLPRANGAGTRCSSLRSPQLIMAPGEPKVGPSCPSLLPTDTSISGGRGLLSHFQRTNNGLQSWWAVASLTLSLLQQRNYILFLCYQLLEETPLQAPLSGSSQLLPSPWPQDKATAQLYLGQDPLHSPGNAGAITNEALQHPNTITAELRP